MSEWKIYKGTDEQIEEILYAGGYIIRTNTGYESAIRMAVGKRKDLISELNDGNVTHYLICKKHQLADMIVRWAMTGQPVWWRPINSQIWGTEASWSCDYIPWSSNSEYEFSFTPFEDGKIT